MFKKTRNALKKHRRRKERLKAKRKHQLTTRQKKSAS